MTPDVDKIFDVDKSIPNMVLIRSEITSAVAQLSPPLVAPLISKLDEILNKQSDGSLSSIEKIRSEFLLEIIPLLPEEHSEKEFADIYPEMPFKNIIHNFKDNLISSITSAFTRLSLRFSLSEAEKLEIYRGMLQTRYLDARLKKFFISGEITAPDGSQFQGKGFRSMGQEAIYAAAIRLKRHPNKSEDSSSVSEPYEGDYVTPMIRDLGIALCMGQKPFDVMATQMGKEAIPTYGKDFHIGDFNKGILPPSAPIGISVSTAVGLAMAISGSDRVVITCNGEGALSSGEWHESANFAAVKKLPVVFIVQNNYTALSTPANEQFSSQQLSEKAKGYGMQAITVDGTDPEAVFAAVTEAADACRQGEGPRLVELICFRVAGHAHHDDMLYFGVEPDQYLEYPDIGENGYIDKEKYDFWKTKDPIKFYKTKLYKEGILGDVTNSQIIEEVSAEIEAAAENVIEAPWPPPEDAGASPFFSEAAETHSEPLKNRNNIIRNLDFDWHSGSDMDFVPSSSGKTFWEAIVEALKEEMTRDSDTFIIGEDVGGKYGNAFLILKSLLDEFGDRMINTPLSESAIIGASVGAALSGKRPIAEIQFNDFIASGFNQLVNNAAKIFYRWGHKVPLTIRMPWGGLRQAGPYHSQNTEAWFYRTPGIKIVCPSTPLEAKGLLKSAIRDDNPVLFYEHIALYRATDIKQELPSEEDDIIIPIGSAHLKRKGKDVTVISYGAYVHKCLSVAETLQEDHGISTMVLDLRSLVPLDKNAILTSVVSTGKVLIVTEDSKRGSIGQSVASLIAEEIFEYLDAPIRVLGALDTPVPYSPPLEKEFLVSEKQIVDAIKLLNDY